VEVSGQARKKRRCIAVPARPSPATLGTAERRTNPLAKRYMAAQMRLVELSIILRGKITPMWLMRPVGKAANIFYLIAGLSLVNTFLAISGVNLALALGLGITRIFDQALKSGGSAGPVLVVNAAVAGVFVAIGVFAKRGSSAAFLIGLLLYAGDAVLLCIDGVLIHIPSIIVHGIFLAGLFGGYRLTRE